MKLRMLEMIAKKNPELMVMWEEGAPPERVTGVVYDRNLGFVFSTERARYCFTEKDSL